MKRKLSFSFMLFPCTFLSALIGCGGGGGGGGNGGDTEYSLAKSARDLNPIDFVVDATEPLNTDEFINELYNTEAFANDDSVEPDPEGNCIEKILGAEKAKRRNDGAYEIYCKPIEVKNCFSALADESEVVINSFTVSFFESEIICKDLSDNMVDVEGMTLSEINDLDCTQNIIRMSTKMHAEINTEAGVVKVVTSMVSTRNNSAYFNEPCTMETEVANCSDITVFKYVYPDFSQWNFNDKTEVNVESVQIVEDAKYFADGTMSFEINNWYGTMTYGSDANVPPTFEATDELQIVAGTYDLDYASARSQMLKIPSTSFERIPPYRFIDRLITQTVDRTAALAAAERR